LTEEEVKQGAVYPDLNRIREISEKVAIDVVKYLFDAELATYRPEPHDHESWVKSKVLTSFF
jgi:malic enzyme